MKILKELFQKKLCNECYYRSEYFNLLNFHYQDTKELIYYDKIYSFILSLSEKNEKILFFDVTKSNANTLVCVTASEEYDYKGMLKEITIKGYSKQFILGEETRPQLLFVRANQNITKSGSYLQNFYIEDFLCIPNKGYGSIMMKSLIDYAKTFNIEYISGFLSFVDTKDEEHNQRLRHFYKKFGFTITEDDKIKLEIQYKTY